MLKPQRFSFTSNSLSKRDYLLSLLNIVLGKSKSHKEKVTGILGEYFKVKKEQLFFFGAARMSVYSLLKSMNLGPKDEVLVAGYTCVVLTNAIKFAGCAIRYVDIELQNFNPSINSLLDAIRPETKVIIVSHNFGLPTNDISRIKAEHPEIIVVEDVAHSLGSTFKSGELCGKAGDAAFFSLEYSKPISCGLGGILLINNYSLVREFTDRYKQLGFADSLMTWKIILTLGALNLWSFKWTSIFQSASIRLLSLLGLRYATSQKEIKGELPDNYPVRLSPNLFCFLLPQLEKLDRINAQKKTIAEFYKSELSLFEDIQSLDIYDSILIRYPILFKPNVSLNVVNAIKAESRKKGFVFGEWFNDVVHPKGSFRYGYEPGMCPNGEFVAARIANLPVNVNRKVSQSDMDEIKEIFKRQGIK